MNGARPRVLVVDDEPLIRTIVERTLRAGYVVEAAPGALEAEALLVAGARYALILCDLSMPNADGFHLWRVVHASVPSSAGRFAFMTGGPRSLYDAERLERTGAPVLIKPFDRATLLGFVERQLPAPFAAAAR